MEEKYRVVPLGPMHAHTDSVTSIACSLNRNDTIVTSSRDKSLIVWRLYIGFSGPMPCGFVHRRLTGHSHAVQDVALSYDGKFALSGSSDGELRLWHLRYGTTARRFVGHTKEVLSVAFTLDSKHIVSASSDNIVKIWNTLGECKYTFQGIRGIPFKIPNIYVSRKKKKGKQGRNNKEKIDIDNKTETSDIFPDNALLPSFVSGSWDKGVMIWNMTNNEPRGTLKGHNGSLKNVVVSPDGSLCASGGNDGKICMWNLYDGRQMKSLETFSSIHALCFCPNRFLLSVATEKGIQIWDLESQSLCLTLDVDLEWESEMYGYLPNAAKTQAFKEAELLKLKAKIPGLTDIQYAGMIRKMWEESSDNPLNQVNKSPKQLSEPLKVFADASFIMQQGNLRKSDICVLLQSENVEFFTTSCTISELRENHWTNFKFAMDAIEERCGHGHAKEGSSVHCLRNYLHGTDYLVATASESLYRELTLLPGIRFISFEDSVLSSKKCSPQDASEQVRKLRLINLFWEKKAFKDAELLKLKAKIPGLTDIQYDGMIRKMLEEFPDNPLNQVNRRPKQLSKPVKVLADASTFVIMQQNYLTKSDICDLLQSENVEVFMTSCTIAELGEDRWTSFQIFMDAIEERCGHGNAEYSSLQCFRKYLHGTDYVVATASVSLYGGLNLLPGYRFISFKDGVLSLKNCSPQDVSYCTSLCWSVDGSTIFSGYTDGVVRAWLICDENDMYQQKSQRQKSQLGNDTL